MAIEANQKVSIEYEVKSAGELIDSNIGKEPLEFVFGQGQLIAGLESRIADMSTGESKEIIVPASEAYGEYNEEAMQTVPKDQIGQSDEIQVGSILSGQGSDGNPVQVIVKEIQENDVVIDFNHPLAGKELTFNVKVLSVA